MDHELAKVRLWSRLAAIAIAALALIPLAAIGPARQFGAQTPGAAAIEAVVARIESADRAPPPRMTDAILATATPLPVAGAPAGGGPELRLWRYGSAGEIVFDDAEQFQRCVDARRDRRDASDCPSALETAELRYAAVERRGLLIDRPRPGRRS